MKPYIFRILMKNTSQKSIVYVEKMFRENFLVIIKGKKLEKMIFSKVYKTIHFQNPHEKCFSEINSKS